MQTYESYSAIQFTELVDMELRSNSVLSIIGSGLSTFLTSVIIARVRSQLFNHTVDRYDLREPRVKHRYEEKIMVEALKHLYVLPVRVVLTLLINGQT